MNGKTIGYCLGVSLVLGFCVFLASTQILGIPWWWVSRGLFPLETMPLESTFVVTFDPKAPSEIGDSVLVKVVNASSKLPVEGVTVSLRKNGDNIHDYYTNASGEAVVEYVGDVTIIEISKTDFKTVLEAIPRSPAIWVRDQYGALLIGVTSAVIGSVTTYMLQTKQKTRGKTKRR